MDRYRLAAGATVLVDEAGMIGTGPLHELVRLAGHHRWRLVLVGDPRQLQAVGRGGMFDQLCRMGMVRELQRIHRFTKPWEAAASLQLRQGDHGALDAYMAHDRIVAGSFEQHAATIAQAWIDATRRRETVAITAATNDHVEELNRVIQLARAKRGEIDACEHVRIAGRDVACVGDVIATRRNNRQLITDRGEPVRNRDLWTVAARHADGSITVTHVGGPGTVTLPGDYVRAHVRLGYAATEHGSQSDTVTIGINVASAATSRRGMYVGATRGRERNTIHVVTDSDDLDEARDVLEAVLASDRADLPAVTQRQFLAEVVTDPPHPAPARRVVPPPRCVIPDCFNTVEAWAHEQLTAAREAIHASDRRLHRLDERAAALARATAAFEPHRSALLAAERAMSSAEIAVRDAQRRLDESRLRDRRTARHELRDAEQALVTATDHLNRVLPVAGPLRDACIDARSQHETTRRTMIATEISDRWSDHPARVDRLERVLDAVDTWRQWTLGHDMPAQRLTDSAAVIRQATIDKRDLRPLNEIAATVDGWATSARLDRAPAPRGLQRSAPVPPLGLSIDV